MLITEQENTMSSSNFVPYYDHVNSRFKLVFYTNECTYLLNIKSKLLI